MKTQVRPDSPRIRRPSAMPAAWLSACASDPVVVSMPGECSAPIISMVEPSTLKSSRADSCSRPTSMSAAYSTRA